ncbi:MAG: hypothetical protein ACR2H9_12700 [Longimicrobiaceae bacterium]
MMTRQADPRARLDLARAEAIVCRAGWKATTTGDPELRPNVPE